MPSPILILAAVALLAGAALGVLAVLIIGIRRGDRRHLANPSHCHSEAFARRVLVGVRYPVQNIEGEDQ
jgi:hypothetical protein